MKIRNDVNVLCCLGESYLLNETRLSVWPTSSRLSDIYLLTYELTYCGSPRPCTLEASSLPLIFFTLTLWGELLWPPLYRGRSWGRGNKITHRRMQMQTAKRPFNSALHQLSTWMAMDIPLVFLPCSPEYAPSGHLHPSFPRQLSNTDFKLYPVTLTRVSYFSPSQLSVKRPV